MTSIEEKYLKVLKFIESDDMPLDIEEYALKEYGYRRAKEDLKELLDL